MARRGRARGAAPSSAPEAATPPEGPPNPAAPERQPAEERQKGGFTPIAREAPNFTPRPLPRDPGGYVDPTPERTESHGYRTGQQLQGVASVYWEGRQTANGERFNPNDHNDLTIAHKYLPFGTVLRLDAGNGRTVLARVNDRGPFIKGREFDLSRATAQELGVGGLSMIRATVVHLGTGGYHARD